MQAVITTPEKTRFNTSEAAEYIGLKPTTLNSWRVSGASTLKYRKVGRLVYYFKSDLDEYLASCTKTHTGER